MTKEVGQFQGEYWKRMTKITLRWAVVFFVLGVLGWATGCMERLFYVPTRGDTPLNEAPAGSEGVWFESADGTRLYGWLAPAHGDPDRMGEHPTILHVHGNAGNLISHIAFTDHLPRRGFNLLIFDFRGYGQSDGSPWRRTKLIEDTHAALDVLLERDDIDNDRIGVFGQSLGASIALNVMAEREEIKAAVYESPFVSWRLIAANALGGDPPFFLARWLAAALIPDHARADDAIRRIDRPILLMHGKADRIVPISHSRALYDAGGECVELIEVENGDHNTLRMEHLWLNSEMVEFFSTHLDAGED